MLERTRPVANSTTDGTPIPTAGGGGAPRGLDRGDHLAEQVVGARGLGGLEHRVAEALVLERGDGDLRPPTSTPISWPLSTLVNRGGEGSSAEPAACRAR